MLLNSILSKSLKYNLAIAVWYSSRHITFFVMMGVALVMTQMNVFDYNTSLMDTLAPESIYSMAYQ